MNEGSLMSEKYEYPRVKNLAGNEGNVIMSIYGTLRCRLTSSDLNSLLGRQTAFLFYTLLWADNFKMVAICELRCKIKS